MRKTLSLIIVGVLCLSMFSILAPQVKAQATSNTSDPTDDLYHYQDGSPAPTWPVIDIVYAEISQVDSANIKLLMQANQPIPLTNQWQGYYWLLDTGIPAPPYWNPIDSNDINVAYQVGVHWAATGPLAVHVQNLVDGTTIYYEDARDHPEQYFSDDTCFITIPLSWISNPTSIKWVANSIDGVASPSGRHDKAPNTGHVTLTIELPSVVSATVDVDPDTLNLKSNGEWITAYIELPESYDVSEIDVGSILLNNTVPVNVEAPMTIGDYDLDIIPDLMVKFDRAAIIEWLDTNDYGEDTGKYYEINLTITGTVSQTKFTGTDQVTVLKK